MMLWELLAVAILSSLVRESDATTNAETLSPVYLLHRFMDRIKVEVLRGSEDDVTLREDENQPTISHGRQCLLSCYARFGDKINSIVDNQSHTSIMVDASMSLFKKDIVIGVCKSYEGVRHCMDSCEFPLSHFREFPLSPAYRFLTEPLDYVCTTKFDVLTHVLPCFSSANTTVDRICSSRCNNRSGLDAVLNFAITEPQHLHKQVAVARVEEMCSHLECSLSCETDLYDRLCESTLPSNLIRQFYHSFYLNTVEFLDPILPSQRAIDETCHSIATPVEQLPFTTTDPADQWWRRVTKKMTKPSTRHLPKETNHLPNVTKGDVIGSLEVILPPRQSNEVLLPPRSAEENRDRQNQQREIPGYPSAQPVTRHTTKNPSTDADLGYEITERLTPPPFRTTPLQERQATKTLENNLEDLINVFDVDGGRMSTKRALITALPAPNMITDDFRDQDDTTHSLNDLVNVFDIDGGSTTFETLPVTQSESTLRTRATVPTRYTITPMGHNFVTTHSGHTSTLSTTATQTGTIRPFSTPHTTRRPEEYSSTQDTTNTYSPTTNVFMTTEQESQLDGLINIFDPDTYNANNADPSDAYNANNADPSDAYNANNAEPSDAYNANNADPSDAYNPNSAEPTKPTTPYAYDEDMQCASADDVERVMKPLMTMVEQLKQQQSDVVRLVQALLRAQENTGGTQYVKTKRQTDGAPRHQRVQDDRRAVRVEHREEVPSSSVKQMVGEIMNKFRLTRL